MNLDRMILLSKESKKAERDFFNYIYDYMKSVCTWHIRVNNWSRNCLDDLLDVCNESLAKALNGYKIGSNNFKSYLRKIIENDIVNYVQNETDHQIHSAFSLDEMVPGTDSTYANIFGEFDKSIYSIIDCQEKTECISETCERKFEDEERLVFRLRLQDKTYAEIAKELNCTEKHARYVFSKCRKYINDKSTK